MRRKYNKINILEDNTAKIYLNNTDYALVDIDSIQKLKCYKWSIRVPKNGSTSYAQTEGDQAFTTSSKMSMHRYLMDFPKDKEVDHINGNGLDNRISNLRICSRLDNAINRKVSKRSKTGYIGVYENSPMDTIKSGYMRQYVVKIHTDEKYEIISYHKTKEEAALAYNKVAKEIYGEFARLNEIKTPV